MRFPRLVRLASALGTALVPAAAGAQEAPAAAPPPPPKPYDISVDVGYVNVTGNKTLTTFSFGDKASYKTGLWQFTQTLNAVYARADGVLNAEFYRTQWRTDYALGARFTLFGVVGWDRNRFAGIENRWAEDAGLSWKAVATDDDRLDLEAGGGLVQQADLGGVRSDFGAARGALLYKHQFSKAAYVQESVEGIANVEAADDWRLNSETAIVAPLSSHLSLKASYLVRYQNAPPLNPALVPPAPFRKADYVLTTGLQVSF